MKIKLGCDPELFLFHKFEGFVSAYGKFPGTKQEPYKVDRGAFQVDGMALEFNIDPADSEDEFERNIRVVMSQMEEMVKKYDPELSLRITSLAEFDPTYFMLQPLESKILGCDPDYDVDGNVRTPSDELTHSPVRTAAGHVHIGWTSGVQANDPLHFEDCKTIASLFKDYPLFTPQTKEDETRVKYYGGNNPFRPKSYGVELRAPSNYWVKQEKTRRQMYRQVVQKMESL